MPGKKKTTHANKTKKSGVVSNAQIKKITKERDSAQKKLEKALKEIAKIKKENAKKIAAIKKVAPKKASAAGKKGRGRPRKKATATHNTMAEKPKAGKRRGRPRKKAE